MIRAVIKRDWRSVRNNPGQALMAPAFFILATMLFPLGLGTDPQILTLAAPGLLVIAALFASLLPLEIMFQADRDDGTLDAVLSDTGTLGPYVAGKIFSHWLYCGLTLIVVGPVMAVTLGLIGYWQDVLYALAPATILLCLIGSFGSALTLGTKQGSVLLALLVLPLYIPVMIFSAGAIDMARAGLDNSAALLILWALTAAAVPIMPLVISAILKFQIRS